MAIVIESALPDDLETVLVLLSRSKLPETGLRDVQTLLVARVNRRLVGCAALELYLPYALLRSVAVDEAYRGQGIGRCLTDAALIAARQYGVQAVYLLTETAPKFFASLGFGPVDRADVPAAVQASPEFSGACCQSAVAMTRSLESTQVA